MYRIPEAGRNSRGRPIVNLLELRPDEKIAAYVPVREFDDTHYLVAATERGVINKQPLKAYANVRRDGINAFSLDEGDRLIECKLTDGTMDIILGTRKGQAVHFQESDVRELGRNTRGVRGITLRGDDAVVSMIIVDKTNQVLTVTTKGFGKRTDVLEYRITNRGGSGIINIKMTERNGEVVALKRVTNDCDVMLITHGGIVIRTDGGSISHVGRNTQGVKIINLSENDRVIDCVIVGKDEDEPAQAAVGAGEQVVEEEAPADEGADDTPPVEGAEEAPGAGEGEKQ